MTFLRRLSITFRWAWSRKYWARSAHQYAEGIAESVDAVGVLLWWIGFLVFRPLGEVWSRTVYAVWFAWKLKPEAAEKMEKAMRKADSTCHAREGG